MSFASPVMAATPLSRSCPLCIISVQLLVAEGFREAVAAGQLLRVLSLDHQAAKLVTSQWSHLRPAQPHYVPREVALLLTSNQQRVLCPQAEVRVLCSPPDAVSEAWMFHGWNLQQRQGGGGWPSGPAHTHRVFPLQPQPLGSGTIDVLAGSSVITVCHETWPDRRIDSSIGATTCSPHHRGCLLPATPDARVDR